VVERPLRLESRVTAKAIESLRYNSGDEDIRRALYDEFGETLYSGFARIAAKVEKRLDDWGDDDGDDDDVEASGKKGLSDKKKKKLLDPRTWERDAGLVAAAEALQGALGDKLCKDHNKFRDKADAALKAADIKLGAADLKQLMRAVSVQSESAPPVIARIHKPGKVQPDPLHGLFEATIDGKSAVVEYESDSELRDTEQVPLLEEGGMEAFFRREVLPYTPDAWMLEDAAKIGYEISFTRHFYKPQPLRTLEEIVADIRAIERESEGLLDGLIGKGK